MASPLGPGAGAGGTSDGAGAAPSPLAAAAAGAVPTATPTPQPFRQQQPGGGRAPFRTDVVRRTALSTATLLRTSKAGGASGPGGLASASTGLLGDQEAGVQLSEAQLAKLEENVNVKIDNEIQILLDGFRQIVGLAMIRDKDRYLLAQESYQAEMRAHNMVRAAQSLTLLSASLKLSLILSLEPGEQDADTPTSDPQSAPSSGDRQPQSAKELIEDTERLRERCAELLGALGVGLGHAPTEVASETVEPSSGSVDMAVDPQLLPSAGPVPEANQSSGS